MTGFDLRGRLEEIGTPTLVVFGGRDRLVHPADSRALAEGLRRGRLHEFPQGATPRSWSTTASSARS
jgi:pimeloyl-ACP methyl ester carboxylesterase